MLKPAGLDASTGLITADYRMDPTDPQWQETDDYKEWSAFMDKYMPQGNKADSNHTYGYAACKTLVQVLEQAGDDLSRENIMKQAASLHDVRVPMLLPGITLNTSATDFYPIEAMQLMKFNGETWERFGDVISAESSGS